MMAYRPAEPGSIMVVDDDPDLCVLVIHWLEEEGYPAEVFNDGESCLAGLARSLPDCICLDLEMPGLSGLETLERIKAHHPLLPVIVLTATSDVETVVSTMQAGAHDYLVKPIDRPKLFTTLKRAVEHHRMSMRLAQLEREVEGPGYGRLLGESPAMKRLFRQMDRVAPSDITVLVLGESGTGKELVAQALHENSGRREGAFVPVNCAAIPENLEESEFFGHEKGSFTGAAGRAPHRSHRAGPSRHPVPRRGGRAVGGAAGQAPAGAAGAALPAGRRLERDRLGFSTEDKPQAEAYHRATMQRYLASAPLDEPWSGLAGESRELRRSRGEEMAGYLWDRLETGQPVKAVEGALSMLEQAAGWPSELSREILTIVAVSLVSCVRDTWYNCSSKDDSMPPGRPKAELVLA